MSSVPKEMRTAGPYPNTPSRASPLSERGGSIAGLNQMGKNYMQYSQGGSYDDQDYSLYAQANYGTHGGAVMTREDPRVIEAALDDAQRLPPGMPVSEHLNHSGKPAGFEVVNQEALARAQAETSRPPQASSQVGNYYSCPACGDLAVKTCGCQFRDASCSKGHSWYLEGGQRKPGISPGHNKSNHSADGQRGHPVASK